MRGRGRPVNSDRRARLERAKALGRIAYRLARAAKIKGYIEVELGRFRVRNWGPGSLSIALYGAANLASCDDDFSESSMSAIATAKCLTSAGTRPARSRLCASSQARGSERCASSLIPFHSRFVAKARSTRHDTLPGDGDDRMPLLRGNVFGYDVARMSFEFTMLTSDARTVECSISGAALDHFAG